MVHLKHLMSQIMRRTRWVCAALLAGVAGAGTAERAAARDEEFNYDESKVPTYSLPDPLVTEDGQAVTSAAMWRDRRRGELLALFEKHVYGRRPPQPRMIRFQVTESTPDYLHGKGKRKDVRAEWVTDEGPVPMLSFTLFVPVVRRDSLVRYRLG